jgi:hypothetical protein
MRFKIWLENMESAEDIFRRLSGLISSAPTYQAATQSLAKEGIVANFDTNRHSGLGHRWSESFYNGIVGDKGNDKQNPELDRQLASLNSQILSLGFQRLDSTDPFYFFGIPGHKPDGAKGKIHVKIPAERPEFLLDLAQIIKSNLSYVRQFKFSAFGGGFESRRDNFVIYLSKQGEENLNNFRQQISSLGLSTDVGQDFKGEKSGWSLSQTQLVSLRLAAMLVSKPGSPKPTSPSSSHWQTTEKEFLMSDPIGSRYLRDSGTTPTGGSNSSAEYQPKTLVLATKSRPLTINVDTQIGKYVLQQSLGNEAQYFSDPQFQVKKSADGWYLVPNQSAINRTTINGSVVAGATKINPNDSIGIVGKSGNQIAPLRVTSV